MQPDGIREIVNTGATRYEVQRDGRRVAVFDAYEDAARFVDPCVRIVAGWASPDFAIGQSVYCEGWGAEAMQVVGVCWSPDQGAGADPAMGRWTYALRMATGRWVRVIQADDDQIATSPFVEAGQD